MKISDFAGTVPVFEPRKVFAGELDGWAVVESPLGGLQKRAVIKARGRWDDAASLIRFTETWTFDDGHVDTLAWEIVPLGGNRYGGREPTLDGEAAGEQAGCAFHWTYTRDVPQADGGSSRLNFDDWFYRIDERAVIVRGTAGRLGLPFASAHVTYRTA